MTPTPHSSFREPAHLSPIHIIRSCDVFQTSATRVFYVPPGLLKSRKGQDDVRMTSTCVVYAVFKQHQYLGIQAHAVHDALSD